MKTQKKYEVLTKLKNGNVLGHVYAAHSKQEAIMAAMSHAQRHRLKVEQFKATQMSGSVPTGFSRHVKNPRTFFVGPSGDAEVRGEGAFETWGKTAKKRKKTAMSTAKKKYIVSIPVKGGKKAVIALRADSCSKAKATVSKLFRDRGLKSTGMKCKETSESTPVGYVAFMKTLGKPAKKTPKKSPRKPAKKPAKRSGSLDARIARIARGR